MATCLLEGVRLIIFQFLIFQVIFLLVLLWLCIRKSTYLLFKGGGYSYSMGYVYCFCKKFQGLRLFKGVLTFIPDSRVCDFVNHLVPLCKSKQVLANFMVAFFFLTCMHTSLPKFLTKNAIQSRYFHSDLHIICFKNTTSSAYANIFLCIVKSVHRIMNF